MKNCIYSIKIDKNIKTRGMNCLYFEIDFFKNGKRLNDSELNTIYFPRALENDEFFKDLEKLQNCKISKDSVLGVFKTFKILVEDWEKSRNKIGDII